MINALLIIVFCQFAGEMISHFSGMPVPGPVLGMVLLLTGLVIKGGLPDTLDRTASAFVKYIGLLFVPAGAGISMYLQLIAEQWLVILAASFTSTAATLVLTAFLFRLFEKREPE